MEQLSCSSTQEEMVTCNSDIFSIADLRQSFRSKSLPSRSKVSIVGVVTAVGEVLRNGLEGRCTFAVEVKDSDSPHEKFGLIVQTPSLLHLAKTLVLHDTYLFTEVRDMLMNKGTSTESRVLATTAESAIHPYSCMQPDSQPPPKKKCKKESELEHPCPASTCHDSHFISYQGILTECVLPGAGLYRLDNGVMLYTTHRHCLDGGRGLRPGSSLELFNVHPMRLPSPLQRASGFWCCAKSTVRVSQFSHDPLPFKPLLSKSKLCRFLRQFSPIDTAYLTHTYVSLTKRYPVETSYTIINELAKIAGLSSSVKDETSEFFSSPHTCSFTLTQDHHSNRPMVASCIADFQKVVEERSKMAGVPWVGSAKHLSGSRFCTSFPSVNAEHVQWSYLILGSSDVSTEVLVGHVECCERTGYLTIRDENGAIPVVCLISSMPQCDSAPNTEPNSAPNTEPNSAHTNLLKAVGGIVLLSGLTVYVERRTTVPKLEDSRPFIYVSPQSCTVVTPPPAPRQDCSLLHFHIVSKNCVVITSKLGMTFNAIVTFATSLNSLEQTAEQSSTSPATSSARESVEVALCFTGEAFKWYSYVVNGGVYSIIAPSRKLPSLAELAESSFLQVTSDMELKFLGHRSLPQPVYDTTELVDKIPLPGFLKEGEAEKVHGKSLWAELFALKGVIVKHEYRIHRSVLSTPPTLLTPPTGAATTHQHLNTETLLTLKVQSLTHPDSLMLYYSLKAGQPHPLGLLPGSVATFYSLTLRSSKGGNIYCESTASTSIALHSVTTITSSSPSSVTPQMLALETAYFGDLMRSLLIGSLSRRVVCVQCRVTSVQRLSLQYKCTACGFVVVDGRCMATCPASRPTLKAEGRFILDDGSGEGQLYASDSMVREVLGVAQRQWEELNDIVVEIGHLVYTKSYRDHPKCMSGKLLTAENRGKALLSELSTRLQLHRALKIYCEPFVSSAELTECVVGGKQQLRRGYHMLALPRLQLRAVAVLELTGSTGICSNTTKQLLGKLKQME